MFWVIICTLMNFLANFIVMLYDITYRKNFIGNESFLKNFLEGYVCLKGCGFFGYCADRLVQ